MKVKVFRPTKSAGGEVDVIEVVNSLLTGTLGRWFRSQRASDINSQHLMLTSDDLTVVKVELPQEESFVVASSYMDQEKTAPPAEVSNILASKGPSEDIVLGCDASARHTIWRSSKNKKFGALETV
ncbi:hypothetical protein EVAR_72524_1 [Eumeta japonica]|uniref:Uncharacterized protein n=1 Tax=Eumeta variegata TaxID=151549 RepID=A0A4C1STU8_EUMVA|nr:hypothetical protein EVAR_72524_1 [Eumeta japonica]